MAWGGLGIPGANRAGRFISRLQTERGEMVEGGSRMDGGKYVQSVPPKKTVQI